jgi:hypothetical protein
MQCHWQSVVGAIDEATTEHVKRAVVREVLHKSRRCRIGQSTIRLLQMPMGLLLRAEELE